MSTQANKERQGMNEGQSQLERMLVETVDYRTSAGQGQEMKAVQIIHQPHSTLKSTTSGGVLANAAASVATALQSAKDAIARD